MQIDIFWLRENFRKFNEQYFDGVLPTPRFYIGRSRTRLGSLAYKKPLHSPPRLGRMMHAIGLGNLSPSPIVDGKAAFTLTLSNYYDQTEYQFKNVLLHEMIHLSIAASGVKDSSPHGVVFRGMMSRLNREGWNISVTTPMRGTPKAYTGSKNVIQNYLVLALEMRDGKHYLSSVNPKFAKAINRRLKMVREIKSYNWYTTSDHWFEDMPKVRSLRGRRVDTDTYTRKTMQMKPVEVA